MEQLLKVQHDFVPGWLTREEGSVLQWMATLLPQGSTVVETGSYAGLSTRYLALGCELSKSNLYAIDLFSGEMPGEAQYFPQEFFDEATWLIQNQGEALVRVAMTPFGDQRKKVNIVRGDAVKVGAAWKRNSKPLVDLMFIDDNHEECKKTTFTWLDNLAAHAMIMFHDIHEMKTYGPDGPINTMTFLQLKGWKPYARAGLIGLITRDPEWWNVRQRAVRDLFDAVRRQDPSSWSNLITVPDARGARAGVVGGDGVRGQDAASGDRDRNAAEAPQEPPAH